MTRAFHLCSLERQASPCAYLAHHEPQSVETLSTLCLLLSIDLLVWHAEQGPLSGQLTQACVAKFESSKDALFLVPAIPGMQRAQVLQVTSLHPSQVQQSSVLCSSGLQSPDSLACKAWTSWCCLVTFCCSGDDCTPKSFVISVCHNTWQTGRSTAAC